MRASRSALLTAATARCGSQTLSSGPAAMSLSTSSSAPVWTAATAASARRAQVVRDTGVAGEVQRQGGGAPVPRGEHVLHAGDALAHGHAAHLRQRQRRGAGPHPAEDDRHAQLAALRRVGLDALDRGPPAEHHAGREVLDLALAVDRRVGDDGDRLLEVVGERHRDRGERAERAVPAERADRLGAAVGVELELLAVALDPARGREEDLQVELRLGQVVVGDLLDGDGVEAAGQEGARLGVRQGAAALGAGVHLALELPVVEHLRHAVGAGDQGHLLAGGEGGGVAGELGHRDDPRLRRDDVHLAGLDPPQRAQAHRVTAKTISSFARQARATGPCA